MVPFLVNGVEAMGLIDTGATSSSINCELSSDLLTTHSRTFVGFSGKPQHLYQTVPLPVQLAGQTFNHVFTHSPQTPVNLLGRDLLIKTQATILCSPLGIEVRFPNGHTMTCCDSVSTPGHFLMSELPVVDQMADIYWALLHPESYDEPGLFSAFQLWRPWILSLRPYLPPPDPLHCTLLYDRDGTEIAYAEKFRGIEGNQWKLSSSSIIVGPEGVAGTCDLTPDQQIWYQMAASAAPHISLALSPGHAAKELGPMMKRASTLTDWRQSDLPQVTFSPSTKMYKIMFEPTTNSSILEHVFIDRQHGREHTDHEEAASMLTSLPQSLWSAGPFDVGHCTSTAAVQIKVVPDSHVRRHQYRWTPDADEGMENTLTGLWHSGVLELSDSDWCTPLRPVLKADGKSYRMAHDLRAVNDVTTTPVLPVPDPHRMLASISPHCQWFSAIDLANAFFCIPLHPESRKYFAFRYKGVNLQYTRLPQGFKNSPGIFNQALKALLFDLVLPQSCSLMMYVDDLLVSAPSSEACLQTTELVLRRLAELGFKVSRQKLQCCRKAVTFLGRLVSAQGLSMSSEHRLTILQHKRPETVREMLQFLGLCGYSRNYIPCFTDRTTPLRALAKAVGLSNLSASLTWTPEEDALYTALVRDLATAAALATPDYSQPFKLDVSMSPTTANAVLFQTIQGQRRVLMYCSVPLDSIEARQPLCTRFAAGLAKVIQKTAHLVMSHPLTITTDHSVTAYVSSQSFTMSSLRQTRLLKVLTAPNLQYVHEGINMAETMQLDPHNCSVAVGKDLRPRPDTHTTPLNTGIHLYTDGCCFRGASGELFAAAAVIWDRGTVFDVYTTQVLHDRPSAQAAEVLAIVLALEAFPGQPITVYSDSAYAVSAALLDLACWKRNGWLSAKGTEIAHKSLMERLDRALTLPSQLAIVKIPGHCKSGSRMAQGNAAADLAAKEAAGYHPHSAIMVSIPTTANPPPGLLPWPDMSQLSHMQHAASPEQKSVWLAGGARRTSDNLWVGPRGTPVLPGDIMTAVLTEAHSPAHVGSSAMMSRLTMWWHPHLRDMCSTFVSQCSTCQDFNVRPTLRPTPGAFPTPTWPGEEIVIDYTDMLTPVRGKRYLLVFVDSFSGWPEAYPCAKEDAVSVVKALINHYIPTHGFPARIRSDNGTHFSNKHLRLVEQTLGLSHSFGCVYHPSSQGSVERMNRTLKEKLAKICCTTGMDWVSALPLALLSVRQSVNRRTGFTPFELRTGRLMPGPASSVHPFEDVPSNPRSLLQYWKLVHALSAAYCAQVKDASGRPTPPPADLPEWTHVYVKRFSRRWHEPRWSGPFRVTARTHTAVRLDGKGTKWFHFSMIRPHEP
ncbi:uncharacterized protein LOC128765183 [Synchiropus splendidus]|uniref:uncharacterized protein LOC128765183 n=1 Tax=Synchiropus splendidus TaxID=270530 RepID=UPI00237D904F|nr:uncharacterized protein LOC128765183 [Synchiropus splendidus]